MTHYIVVREESPGRFVAYPAGLPELTVSSNTRADAILAATSRLSDAVKSGELIPVQVNGRTDSPISIPINDPMQQAFLDAVERSRREDLIQTLAEYEEECPSTSSIPTT